MGRVLITLNALQLSLCFKVLFPNGEFLRTHLVGPLGLSGSLHLGLLLKFSLSYEQPCALFSGRWVVDGGKWWVIPQNFIMYLKFVFFDYYFFNVLSCQGERFLLSAKETIL